MLRVRHGVIEKKQVAAGDVGPVLNDRDVLETADSEGKRATDYEAGAVLDRCGAVTPSAELEDPELEFDARRRWVCERGSDLDVDPGGHVDRE